jgi:LmbE family N-acetylglucosaminyl deacetylase
MPRAAVDGSAACFYSWAVSHVFVSPHPDDAALSCGGLIARLRARGESVTIVTVFSGPGSLDKLTPFQRLALGFGSQDKWEAGDATSLPEEMDADDAPSPGEVMAVRRAEDEAFARFVGASISFVNLPDGVFRGYEGDEQLMGKPRPDDRPPVDHLRQALARLETETLYLPFSVGGHVDHQQTRRAAIALLGDAGSPYQERAVFYEDFPYALTVGFERLDQLDPEILPSLPAGVSLTPEYVEIGDLIDRKLAALQSYESQIGRLFGGGDDPMAAAVRERAARIGEIGSVGPSERYWRVTTA